MEGRQGSQIQELNGEGKDETRSKNVHTQQKHNKIDEKESGLHKMKVRNSSLRRYNEEKLLTK